MKIYLAGRVSKRPKLQLWQTELEAMGHQIVSRWSKAGSNHTPEASERASDEDREKFAREDIEDINNCDCVISLMDEPRAGRGGRHVEFGYALGLGKRLIIVGERETVFHHLPQVEQFDSFENLLKVFSTAEFNSIGNHSNSIVRRMQILEQQSESVLAESIKTMVGFLSYNFGYTKIQIDPKEVQNFNRMAIVITERHENDYVSYTVIPRNDLS